MGAYTQEAALCSAYIRVPIFLVADFTVFQNHKAKHLSKKCKQWHMNLECLHIMKQSLYSILDHLCTACSGT